MKKMKVYCIYCGYIKPDIKTKNKIKCYRKFTKRKPIHKWKNYDD